jgi:hypothetical protein
MTPEVALLIRALLFSMLLVGIEYVSKRRRLRRARSEWLSPVVRLQSAKINPARLNLVEARPIQVNPVQLSPVPTNPVRVQPQVVQFKARREVPAHVFVKRAA